MPGSSRRSLLLVLSIGALGCSAPTRYAQTAYDAPAAISGTLDSGIDAALPRAPDAGVAAPSCPPTLSGRLSLTQIDVNADIRYKRPSYDFFPTDEHIALSSAPDGSAYVGWIENSGPLLHVTPLDTRMLRREADVVLTGDDIGGFVAREDGFALLTRRTDPGQALSDPSDGSTNVLAAFLVRVRGATEAYAVPLTGTASITHPMDPEARDCATPFLYGRLAWNGAKYGAYFVVHGCAGDPHESLYGDKLLYADDRGRPLKGGWSWNCSIDQGLRLVPEADVFTSICLADALPSGGLNLVTEGVPTRQLAPELVATGYSAGQFGSLIKLADGGYMIGWLSRGVTTSGSRLAAAKQATDIALLRLGPSYEAVGGKKWMTETSTRAETNLHLAPYGNDRVLVTWDSITDLRCSTWTCFGTYEGTFARLTDLDGNAVTSDERIAAVPNSADDLNVFANGDIGWAFVAEDARNYATTLTSDRMAQLPHKRRLSVARLRYCP